MRLETTYRKRLGAFVLDDVLHPVFFAFAWVFRESKEIISLLQLLARAQRALDLPLVAHFAPVEVRDAFLQRRKRRRRTHRVLQSDL